MMNDEKVLHQKFSIKKHSQTFFAYCEVLIMPSGQITYAIPSHYEKLKKFYQKQFHLTKQQLKSLIVENLWNVNDLAEQLGVIICWYESVYCPSIITDKQVRALNLLVNNSCMSECIWNDISTTQKIVKYKNLKSF